jgi:hypothetical protein
MELLATRLPSSAQPISAKPPISFLRYQSAARRSYSSVLRALKELQGDRFNRQPAAAPIAPVRDPTPAVTETDPPEALQAALLKIIPFRRRDVETTKIQSEPKIAAACQTAAGPFPALDQISFQSPQ